MRTIAPVVSMFSTSLVAVPALSRVDPAMTSAPTPGANELRHSAGRHTNDDVFLRRPQPRDRPRTFFVVVFDAFLRRKRRVATAGHDCLDE
jgi:hypothetical protein